MEYLSLPHVLNASTMLQTYEEKKKDNLHTGKQGS
jgi:hypothetical protein